MVNESYIKKLIEDNQRIDSRKFDEFRKITLETGVVPSAEGSARVKIGNTHIIVGVKMSVMTPFPDTPEEGVMMVDAELLPLASVEFESGPPSPEAIEFARVVDRGIRESKTIDTEKLCITPGEAVWGVHIDMNVLDHDGNLITAGALGAIAALRSAKMPKYDEETKRVEREPQGPLPLKDAPIEITVAKINNKLLIDPNFEEEKAMDARVTMAVTQNGDFCAMQKGGTGYFTATELEEAADLIIEKSKELRSLLK
jgi:exosome complex component RRP42